MFSAEMMEGIKWLIKENVVKLIIIKLQVLGEGETIVKMGDKICRLSNKRL